jgi:hypothetical protein
LVCITGCGVLLNAGIKLIPAPQPCPAAVAVRQQWRIATNHSLWSNLKDGRNHAVARLWIRGNFRKMTEWLTNATSTILVLIEKVPLAMLALVAAIFALPTARNRFLKERMENSEKKLAVLESMWKHANTFVADRNSNEAIMGKVVLESYFREMFGRELQAEEIIYLLLSDFPLKTILLRVRSGSVVQFNVLIQAYVLTRSRRWLCVQSTFLSIGYFLLGYVSLSFLLLTMAAYQIQMHEYQLLFGISSFTALLISAEFLWLSRPIDSSKDLMTIKCLPLLRQKLSALGQRLSRFVCRSKHTILNRLRKP